MEVVGPEGAVALGAFALARVVAHQYYNSKLLLWDFTTETVLKITFGILEH